MKAAIAEAYGAPLAIRDVDPPQIGTGDILVRVDACGVCATDLKVVQGGLGASPERLPLIPGHEITGTVAETGAEVTSHHAGDSVAVHALFACGTCDYCRAGEDEACPEGIPNLAGVGTDGGYAEFVRVPHDRALPLPPALSPAEAAPLLCAGLTVYAALKNARLEPGQRLAVLGVGGLGHLAIAIGAALGAEVVAVTGSADKRDAARELGASAVASPGDATPLLQERGGAHVALNTVDAPEPLLAVLPGLRRQSTIVLATTSVGELLPIPAGLMMGLQLRIVASFFGSREDLRELLALAVDHDIRPRTERFPLAEANTAHDRLRQNAVRFRAVLEP